jgi:hypothetical protein
VTAASAGSCSSILADERADKFWRGVARCDFWAVSKSRMASTCGSRTYFLGKWILQRSIRDLKGLPIGNVSGSATFQPTPSFSSEVLYTEIGKLSLVTGSGTVAQINLRLSPCV